MGFHRVLLGFTEVHRVLPNFTEFYWVLPGFTEFYWVFISFSWVFLGFTTRTSVEGDRAPVNDSVVRVDRQGTPMLFHFFY